MTDKALSLLGLSRKAGKFIYGFDAVCDSVKKNEAKAVFITKDLSPKSEKEIKYITNKFKVDVLALDADMTEVLAKTGKKCGIMTVTDENLATAIKNELT